MSMQFLDDKDGQLLTRCRSYYLLNQSMVECIQDIAKEGNMMNVLDAAKQVLEEAQGPLPVREITAAMLNKGYWQTQGLTPEATVAARLAMDLKTQGKTSSFVRTAPGRFGLRGQVAEAPNEMAASGVQQALFETEEQDPEATAQTMSFTDAAIEVLQMQEPPRPLHYTEITRIALDKNLLTTKGRTPEATMYAQILTEIERYTKRGIPPRFRKLGQGMVALAKDSGTSGLPSVMSEQDKALLQKIKNNTAAQFEILVAKLLSLMFGTDIQETRISGDAGLDARGKVTIQGGITVDLLAQAKRYTVGNVQRPEIQNLRGSMGPQSFGIFITTAGFSAGAVAEAQRTDALQPIGLVNGRELVGLMKECRLTLDPSGEPILLAEEPPSSDLGE
jgi:restriction system protein